MRSMRFPPRRLLSSFFLFAAVLCVSVTFAQTTQQLIHVDEIRPGMRGYGLSVFRGEQPERFDVEVIDVLHELGTG